MNRAPPAARATALLELESARERILASLPAPLSERVPLAEAERRILAARVVSPLALPGFDNASMDGYAVRAADTVAASAGKSTRLKLVGRVTAGKPLDAALAARACCRVCTGSVLPHGADAVVTQEDTQREGGSVVVRVSVRPGENVRQRGEDVMKGAVLADPGESMTAGRLGLLSAAGQTHVTVGTRPVVGLVVTGTELREPGQTLGPGQVYESIRAMLAILARQAGARVHAFPSVADSLPATCAALRGAFRACDAVITSGGVSVGEADCVKAAFKALGGRLEFWRVAIRPGRPFAFGRWGKKFLYGLPGNPVSAFVTFLLLVRPALLRWQGAADVGLPASHGVLKEALANDGERRHFMRVHVNSAGEVSSAGMQEAHRLRSLAAANGLVDVPPHCSLPVGRSVRVLRWE